MRILTAVFILAMANSLQAQSPNCAAQWTKISSTLAQLRGLAVPPLGLIRERADGGCRTNGLSFPMNDTITVKADSLTWNGRDMERFVADALPPTAFDFQLNGIRVIPTVGDPAFQYLQDVQTRGRKIDVSLSLDWDEATKIVRIDALRVNFPGEDFVSFIGVVEDVDLTSQSSLQASAGRFGLTSGNLDVRSRRLFQDYLLLPLGLTLLDGTDDPAAEISKLKDVAVTAIDAASTDVLPASSKAALKAVVADFPDPSGHLQIKQTANPGIGVARGLGLAVRGRSIEDPSGFWGLLDGIKFDVTYDPL